MRTPPASRKFVWGERIKPAEENLIQSPTSTRTPEITDRQKRCGRSAGGTRRKSISLDVFQIAGLGWLVGCGASLIRVALDASICQITRRYTALGTVCFSSAPPPWRTIHVQSNPHRRFRDIVCVSKAISTEKKYIFQTQNPAAR